MYAHSWKYPNGVSSSGSPSTCSTPSKKIVLERGAKVRGDVACNSFVHGELSLAFSANELNADHFNKS